MAETLKAEVRQGQTYIHQIKVGLPAEGKGTGSEEEMRRIDRYVKKVEEQGAMMHRLQFITDRIAVLEERRAAVGMGGGGGAGGTALRPGDRTWTY